MITTVPVSRFILNRTGWIQVGAATLLAALALLAWLSTPADMLARWVGLLFLLLLAAYMYMTYRWAKQGGKQTGRDETVDPSLLIPLPQAWLMTLGGLFLVVAGARILVPCASEIDQRIGVSDDVIAATMVALGTSLGDYGRQHRRRRRAQLPVCDRCGCRSTAAGHTAQFLHL
jgi:cation:H+ antiporter